MKISISHIQNDFSPGTRFAGIYLADGSNANYIVVKNNTEELVARVLTGEHAGCLNRIAWNGVTAEISPGYVVLASQAVDFLKIKFEEPNKPSIGFLQYGNRRTGLRSV